MKPGILTAAACAICLAAGASCQSPAPMAPQPVAPPSGQPAPALPAGQQAAQPQPAPPQPADGRNAAQSSQPAQHHRPPGATELGFRIECFEAYAGCDAVIGLPAISADGRRVAVPDFGPDTPRDEFVLTMRVKDVATGAEISATPIMTYDDHDAIDLDTGEPAAELRAELEQRTRAFERVLAEGNYRPMIYLGVVHQERAAERAPGLRATFDGSDLVITDPRTGETLWRQTVGPSAPFTRADGEVCGPFPVAELHVWVKRRPRAAVARVGYIGNDVCATELPYLVWP